MIWCIDLEHKDSIVVQLAVHIEQHTDGIT